MLVDMIFTSIFLLTIFTFTEVTNRESINALVTSVTSDLGEDGLTLLLNNAGCLKRLQLKDVTQEEMLESFRINSVAPLCISQVMQN